MKPKKDPNPKDNLKDKKIKALPEKDKQQKPKLPEPKLPQPKPKLEAPFDKREDKREDKKQDNIKTKQKQPQLLVSVNEFAELPKSQTYIQQMAKLKEQMSISQFLQQKFKKVVEEGLKEIVHLRPEDPIKYLGQYLINHSK